MILDARASLALLLVSAEWLVVGWLSGLDWPGPIQAPAWTRWSLRFLVGACLVGVSLLLEAVAGISLRSVPPTLLIAALLALAIRAGWRAAGPRAAAAAGGEPASPHARRPRPGKEALGWLLLAIVLAAAFIRSATVPEAQWDAYSHWGLKAKAYFLAGGIVDTWTAHEYYPPLVPLLEAWLYVHLGEAAIDQAKLIWALAGSAFVLCLAWHFQLVLSRRWLAPFLATAVLLATVQLLESFWTGQADLALTASLTLSALALFQWQRASGGARRRWLLQAAVLAGAASLAKYEGLFRVALVGGAFLLEGLLVASHRRPALVASSLYVGVAILATLPWVAFRALHDIPVTSEHLNGLQLGAMGEVLGALLVTLGGVRTAGGLVVAGLGTLVGLRRLVRPPLRLLLLMVLAQLGSTFVAFLVTGSSPSLQVNLSATRLLMQAQPLALFAIAIAVIDLLAREPETEARRVARAPAAARDSRLPAPLYNHRLDRPLRETRVVQEPPDLPPH